MEFDKLLPLMLEGVLDTLYMVVVSTISAYILGVPLGIVLYITDKDGLKPLALCNKILGTIVNLLRAVPFIILLIAIMPFTRMIVGTTLGINAIIVPLVVSAAPFIARMVESSLKEVNLGVIEAAEAMGSSTWQIITKVLLPEAKPSLIVGSTITITTILGYSAMAGFTGGGGLGAIAINYGYYKYNNEIMLITVVLLVLIVQLFQEVGMKVAKKIDKRIREN